MVIYKTYFALTKTEMEALQEFATKARDSWEENEDKQVLYSALRQVTAGLERTNNYYWGNDKVSIYKDNT